MKVRKLVEYINKKDRYEGYNQKSIPDEIGILKKKVEKIK